MYSERGKQEVHDIQLISSLTLHNSTWIRFSTGSLSELNYSIQQNFSQVDQAYAYELAI